MKKKPLEGLADRISRKRATPVGGRVSAMTPKQVVCALGAHTGPVMSEAPRPPCLPSVCTAWIKSDTAEEGIYF